MKKQQRRKLLALLLAVVMVIAMVPLSAFAAGPGGVLPLEPYLDILPAETDSQAWKDYGTDYNTGYTAQSGISYAGKVGDILDIPYTAALDLSELKETVAGIDDLAVIEEGEGLTFSFQYDPEKLAGPVDTTSDTVQTALYGANPADSLASLYEVKDVTIDPENGTVSVTMALKSEVTGSQLKEALDKSDTLYMEGTLKTKPLEEKWNGDEVALTKGKMEGEIGKISGSDTTIEIDSTTNDANQPGNTDPGFASDSCGLGVSPDTPVPPVSPKSISVPVDLIPTVAGNMRVSNSTPDWYNGHTKDNVNSGVFNSLTGDVGYTAWLGLDSVIEAYQTLTKAGTVGDTVPVSGSMTNSFTFDTTKLTAKTEYADKDELIKALYVANAVNGLNEDAVPSTDVKLANLFVITDVSIVGDKVTIVLTLKEGITGATLALLKDQQITLKTPDDMFMANVSEGNVVWAEKGTLTGKITLEKVGNSQLLPLDLNFVSGTYNEEGKLDTKSPAAEKFVVPTSSTPPIPIKYTLTYIDKGPNGDENKTLKVEYYNPGVKTKPTFDPDPRVDYEFEGWFWDPVQDDQKVTDILMDSNKIIYAKWSEVEPIPITKNHYAYIIGYPDGPVRPMKSVTRAEIATICMRLLTDEARTANWKQECNFSDVVLTNWFNNAVCTMANTGVVNGYPDGTYLPDGMITRAELAKVLVSFTDQNPSYTGANQFSDISGHWAASYINVAVEKGLVKGYSDGSFRPDQPITRAETATMYNRFLDRDTITEEHMLHGAGEKTWTDNLSGTWYYVAMQEATNSHYYTYPSGDVEIWDMMRYPPEWVLLEKPTSQPMDINID